MSGPGDDHHNAYLRIARRYDGGRKLAYAARQLRSARRDFYTHGPPQGYPD